jgi:hypothetical protein
LLSLLPLLLSAFCHRDLPYTYTLFS